MNSLIVGVNSQMAKVFSHFSNVTILAERNYRYYDEMSEYNVIGMKSDNLKIFQIVNYVFELRKIIKNNNVSVVFTNDKYSIVAAYLARQFLNKEIILIATSHDSYAWKSERRVYLYTKLVKKATNGFISLSSHVSDLLWKNGFSKKGLFTTVNPINPGVFEVKANYSIRNIVSIIYVGVIYKGKGHDILLDSIYRLSRDGVEVTVHFYGDIVDQLYYDDLCKKALRYGIRNFVFFHGPVQNSVLRKKISTYDIYVCPSEMEMSPYNVIEAKASGMPILASNIGGIPDIITNGVDGLLFETSNSEQISSTLKSLISDEELREWLGRNAYESSKDKHSPENIANKIKDFLSDLN
jgi:glycosyltransferase involved in cell wall biosynthesis